MRKLIAFVLIILLFTVGILLAAGKTESRRLTPVFQEAAHPDTFFDARYFDTKPAKNAGPFDGKIYGAVVPHHLLAHRLIAGVFAKMREQPPPVVILVGPNHHNRGERIVTGAWSWKTPFGTVEADRVIIDKLLKYSAVKEDDLTLETEHAVGNLMPFIKFYFPGARVVPLILHHDVSRQEAARLAEQLTGLAGKDAVFIASVDFSHYLTQKEAEEKDREILEVLKTWNLGRVFSMGNDYLDSPASIGVLFFAMQKRGLEDFTLLDQTNSGILLGNDLIETTSYLTLIFTDPSFSLGEID